MIVKSIQTGVIAGSVLVASFGLVQAQTGQAQTGAASTSETISESEAVAQDDNRSVEELLASARTDLARMEASADSIGLMLRDAREEKDVVKSVCLNDKLNQMNVATRTAADRVAAMEAAATAQNEDRLRTDAKVLAALVARGNELATEANQCIGKEQGAPGDTSLVITIDPAIPGGDTSSLPPSVIISSPPVAASPTL